jgi:hypothetical protein
MSQYLITFCYLFTIVLLFLAFFIIWTVPSGSQSTLTFIVTFLVIYNSTELGYHSNTTKDTLEEPADNHWNNNWNNNKDQNINEGWNHANDWTPGLGNQPQLNTPEWIDWAFAYISIDQIREIAGCLFA